MEKYLKKILWLFTVTILISSCSKEEVIEKNSPEIQDGKIPVNTEIIIDGVIQTDTRAVSDAGYTTGDGLYDRGDDVTVTAVANEGYELVKFYDKKEPSINLGGSHTLIADIPTTFKAEFARVQNYTISVTASPTAGGSITGGGSYKGGSSCTIIATPNAGYIFDGWYESGTKISSDASYTFTVSSNRTITGIFLYEQFAILANPGSTSGMFITPTNISYIGVKYARGLAYGNGKYIVGGGSGVNSETLITTSINSGISWSSPTVVASAGNPYEIIHSYDNNFVMALAQGNILFSNNSGNSWTTSKVGTNSWYSVTYGGGRYVAVGSSGKVTVSIDGISWTTPQSVGSNNWQRVNYGNGKYVAVGSSGNISSSNDAVNWNSPIQVGTKDWQDIIYAAERYVIVGYNGYISTSIDGENWTTPIQIGTNKWASVTYSHGTFMAVGIDGYFTRSTDGEIWTSPQRLKEVLFMTHL